MIERKEANFSLEELKNMPEDKLWKIYRETHDQRIRDIFIEKYAPLVKYVAGRVAINIPSVIDYDDLIGWGVLGLIDAIERFDPSKDTKFKTYAIIRIRGAIYDELRAVDWVPRSVRQKAREVEKIIGELESRLGRPATDEEIAKELGITVKEFHSLLLRISSSAVVSLNDKWYVGDDDSTISVEDTIESPASMNPEVVMEREEIKNMIVKAIQELPEKEKQVLILYYYEELTLKEIGKVLNVTESRVSQLHTKAIMRLRAKLGGLIRAFEE